MIGRHVLVGLIVFLVAVPATFVGFAMALVVVELVIFPTMTLIIAVVTALVASWAADSLAADGLHTDLAQTVGRHLLWALVPAALAVLSSFVPLPRAYLLAFVVIWMVVAATVLAFRHRREKTSIRRRPAQSGAWLLGTGLVTAVVSRCRPISGSTPRTWASSRGL